MPSDDASHGNFGRGYQHMEAGAAVQDNLCRTAKSRPSDRWPSLEDTIWPDQVKKVVSRANWDYLCMEAVRLHGQRRPESTLPVTCTANTSKCAGGMVNLLFELSFSDGSFWLVRLRRRDGEDGDCEKRMLSE